MNFCRIYNKIRRALNGKDYKPVDSINVILGLIIILSEIVLKPINYLCKSIRTKVKTPKINWFVLFVFIVYILIVVLIALFASLIIQGNRLIGIIVIIFLILIEVLITGIGIYEIKSISYGWTNRYIKTGLVSPFEFIFSIFEKFGKLTTSHCNLKEKK